MDPSRVALSAEQSGRLEGPRRLVFDWSLSEPDLRANGRGVARVEPPFRARLDLFTENGETVVRAALVDGDLRLPSDSRADLVPPPALFWGALGVFRPGAGAILSGAERVSDGVELFYQLQDGDGLRILVHQARVQKLEKLEGGRVVESLELQRDDGAGFPRQARYRHMADFRELTLKVTEVDSVEPYPPDIWNPAG